MGDVTTLVTRSALIPLAPGLDLPEGAATSTYGILAKKGAGKSNAGAVMAEGLHAAGYPFVVIDPVGAWWGLRAGADGKPGGGLDVVVFGGHHGDVPLEPTGGSLVADVVVEHHLSAVLDVSNFESEADKRRFLIAFAERLFRIKGKPGNEYPLHLFLEEADDYVPQRAMGVDQNRCLGAFERIVKRGRARGLGATIISQRSAAVNKDVLTQIDTLIVLRTTSPQDRKAVGEWVRYHGESDEMLASLSALADGEAWVWSPEFLEVMKRVQLPRRATYDSGATPTQRRQMPVVSLAEVDLDALSERMAATIEKQKADDPRELRRQIADLSKQLAIARGDAERALSAAPDPITIVEQVPILTDEDRKAIVGGWEAMGAVLDEAATRMRDALSEMGERIKPFMDAAAQPKTKTSSAPNVRPREAPRPAESPSRLPAQTTAEYPGISRPRQRILDALAMLEQIHVHEPLRAQVALLAGASPKSSGFQNNLSAMHTGGLILYPSGGRLSLTQLGRDHANAASAPQTQEEMQAFAYGLVGNARSRILRVLVDAYPHDLSRGEVADAAGVSAGSSGYQNSLSYLRGLGLIDYPQPGSLVALPILFLEGA